MVKNLPSNTGDMGSVSGCETNIPRMCVCVHMCSAWTVAHQVPLSMEFSREVYWSRSRFPTPGDLPDPGTEPMSIKSPALAGEVFFVLFCF